MSVNEIRHTSPQFVALKQPHKKTATEFKPEIANSEATITKASELQAAELTTSERAYFQELFPQSSEEIRRYNPYQRDGAKADVRIGSLFDKRG